MDKGDIRSRHLALRRGLSRAEVAEKSGAIAGRVGAMPAYREASAVLSYVASKDNEVDTGALIREALAESRIVLVPVAQAGGVLVWSRLGLWEELTPGRFGILEPRAECLRPTVPPEGAVVLVPGIAFRRDGYRIGYGGGYFDRFLTEFGGTALGLAFDSQMVDGFERERHDRPVDVVVTESAVYDGKTGRSG